MTIRNLSDLAPYREAILALAREYKAGNVRVFGSVARDEAEPDSDIDLLVDFAPDYSLRHLIRLTQDLERLLGQPVEVVIAGQLREELRDRILADATPL